MRFSDVFYSKIDKTKLFNGKISLFNSKIELFNGKTKQKCIFFTYISMFHVKHTCLRHADGFVAFFNHVFNSFLIRSTGTEAQPHAQQSYFKVKIQF